MQEEKFNKQDGNLDQPNVNESLALAGLFIKVETECMTCLNHPHVGKQCFNCHGEKKIISYKEIKLPSDDEIENKFPTPKEKDRNSYKYNDSEVKAMYNRRKGAKWMRDFVLAVTAKDNVR